MSNTETSYSNPSPSNATGLRLLFYSMLAWLFTAFMLPFEKAAAQDTLHLPTEMLTVKDGLSQGLVIGILQDRDGFLWFSTKDGLNKYDGYHFTVYRFREKGLNAMPGTTITAIVEDDNGLLWVGTSNKGICIFDKKSGDFFPAKVPNIFGDIPNQELYPKQYKNGQLMVHGGVKMIYDITGINTNNFKTVDFNKLPVRFNESLLFPRDSSNNPTYYFMSWMEDNSVWYGSKDSIILFRPSDQGNYERSQSYAKKRLWAPMQKEEVNVARLPGGTRFIFTGVHYGCVYDFRENRIIRQFEMKDAHVFPRSTSKDQSGNFFIEGYPQGFYFNSNDYSVRPVTGINGGTLDRNGILWKGTMGWGVIKYDYRKQLFRPNLISSTTYRRAANQQGELLLGEEYQSPYFLDVSTKMKREVFPAGTWRKDWLLHNYIADKAGNHWLIFSDRKANTIHLLSQNTRTGQISNKVLSGIYSPRQTKLIVDDNDGLWLANTEKSGKCTLLKISSTSLDIVASYFFPPAISNNCLGYFVSDYWQDAQHVFWFATMQGLCSFDAQKNKWQYWGNDPKNKYSLNNNELYSIAPDPFHPEKYLWVGTNGGGLNRFEIATGRFTNYNEHDGLPNNVVYGILNDSMGNVWLSTNKGLSCFNTGTKTFMNFDTDDGLPGDEFNRYEYAKMPNGDLYFGGMEGGVVFNPEKVLAPEPLPNIVLTGLSVFNKPVLFDTDSTIINVPVTYAKTITLTHEMEMFSISYAALEYRNASKKHYKYRLEGFDNNWIDAGHNTEAFYTNLPPGKYTFHVIGAGRSGIWNTKGASIQIIILPAWWQTWWFRLLVVLLVCAGLYGLYRYRLRQVLKIEKLRNRIASDLHDEIGSSLSSIALFGEVARMNITSDPLKTDELILQINDNTHTMMDAMSDIVWSMSTKNDGYDNLINRMRAFGSRLMEMKGVKFVFLAQGLEKANKMNMIQRKNIYLIFKEALNNAAKYSGCKLLTVDITEENDLLHMTIQDDGKGFDITNKTDESSSGNGLVNMRKRAEEIKGKLRISSSPGVGTTIDLKVKI